MRGDPELRVEAFFYLAMFVAPPSCAHVAPRKLVSRALEETQTRVKKGKKEGMKGEESNFSCLCTRRKYLTLSAEIELIIRTLTFTPCSTSLGSDNLINQEASDLRKWEQFGAIQEE